MQCNVLDYIPHQVPMVFIDELLDYGEAFATAKLSIRPELLFVEPRGLPTWSSIELMAQTISLYAGIHGRALGQVPKIGFLLGTRKLDLPFAFFPLYSEVVIRVEKNYQHQQLAQFDCQIMAQQHCIRAQLSVYQPDSIASVLQGLT
jgi:predicted hotdog family 3-hydroxylacyl-ACP dehydratase